MRYWRTATFMSQHTERHECRGTDDALIALRRTPHEWGWQGLWL